jgi:hypothetical protein
MNALTLSALFLAVIWGAIYAAFLQFTTLGRWMCNRRTYITVIVGIGIDFAIMLLVIPVEYVLTAFVVVGLSAVGIVIRSILNELSEHRELESINASPAHERDQRY